MKWHTQWPSKVECPACREQGTSESATLKHIISVYGYDEGIAAPAHDFRPMHKKTIYLVDDKPPGGRLLPPQGNTPTLASGSLDKAVDVHQQNTSAKDHRVTVCVLPGFILV